MKTQSCFTQKPSSSRGFSLIEVLVVIAIISMLMGILLPALSKARKTARQTKCLVNVRSIATGQGMYSAENRGWYPYWSGWQVYGGQGDGAGGDEAGLGWSELLEPYLSGREAYHDPSRPDEYAPTSYFIAARYSWDRYQRQFSSVREQHVYYPSKFVMGGDCNFPGLYVAPYGTVTDTTREPDCDLDDASQPAVFFEGELEPHDGKSNIFFFDGHAASFDEYEPDKMTWHATKMRPWSLERPQG